MSSSVAAPASASGSAVGSPLRLSAANSQPHDTRHSSSLRQQHETHFTEQGEGGRAGAREKSTPGSPKQLVPETALRGPGRSSGAPASSLSGSEVVLVSSQTAAPRTSKGDGAVYSTNEPVSYGDSSNTSTAALPPLFTTCTVAATTVSARHVDPSCTGSGADGAAPAEASVPAAAAASSSGALRTDRGPQEVPPRKSQPAPVAGPAAAAAASSHSPPQAEAATGSSSTFGRPATALSSQLVALYKRVNARYCHQRRLATPGPKYNHGYDDKEGHYIVLPGEEIFSRYTVQEVLGKGSFGTVLRCYDEKRKETVALKITRHGTSFRNQAKLELDILLRLNENPNLNHLVVKLLKVFDWQGHLVLVFELLSFNLYQLIKCTRYNGVSLELVRKFAYQLVCALLQLEVQRPQSIIHCDIKPENILLRNQNRSGIRLIDFGSACYTDKRIHRYIQSRFYRCPEAILYLEYGTAIDRWSLGCVLVELHTGMPLFDGRTEAAQLARFEATLGPVPADMLKESSKASKFYNALPNGTFQLREPALPRRSLESVIGVTTGGPRGSRKGTQGHDEASYREFLDFVAQLLRYHPSERISCHDALRHPFLAPLYLSDQQQRLAKRQQQQQQQQQQTETAALPE